MPGWITKNTGGAEWQSYILSEKFVENGWDVTVITSRPFTKTNYNYINPKIQYHYYPILKLKTLRFLFALYYVYRAKSNYYYTRTDDKIYRAAAVIIAKFKKSKVIYALAGDDEIQYSKFKNTKNHNFIIRLIKNIDLFLINKLTYKSEHHVDLIICQTRFQKENLLTNKGLDSVIIPNSFVQSNVEVDLSGKENIILWVGNMRPVKRPEVFLEIAEKAKHLDYRFVMIGGNTEYLSNYRAPDNIEILGSQSKEETLHYFKRAKFLINTSQTEGFSNTFLEAWDTGVRIISLNVDPDRLLSEKGFGELCLKKPCVIKVLEKNFDNDVLKQLDAAKKYLATYFNVEKNFKMLEKTIKDESTLVY